MRGLYGYKHILVLPNDLQAFAWSAPMRDLAAKVGLSDVGLRKLLKAHGIVTPPQGHWNRVHAGRRVPICPKAPPRRPGETGRVHLDERFAKVLTPVEPMSSAGPFASAAVPEDLDALYAQELKAIGRAGVRQTLDRVHPGLIHLLGKEERRREKMATERWCFDKPKFGIPLDKRRLRIVNALFLALGRRRHSGEAYEREGELHVTAMVGDMRVGIDVDVAGTRPQDRFR